MLTILFYAILIYVVVKIFRKAKTNRVRYSLLALVGILYTSLYSGDFLRRQGFNSWKRENPAVTIYEDINFAAESSLYLHRFLTCQTLCIELLLNGHFESVETDISPFNRARWIKKAEGKGPAHARWRLVSDEETCWEPANIEVFMDTNYLYSQGLLAQGVCFLPEGLHSPSARLRFDRSEEKESVSGVYTRSIRRKYTLARVEGGKSILVARGNYGTLRVLTFPLLPYVKVYYVPTDIRSVQTIISHGPETNEDFFSDSLGLGFPVRSSRIGPLYDESRIPVILRAARHESEVVRWSAALAMCVLKRTRGDRFNAALRRLSKDEYLGIRNVAGYALREKENQRLCESPGSSSGPMRKSPIRY